MRALTTLAVCLLVCGCPSSPGGDDAGNDGGTDAFSVMTPDAPEVPATDSGPMACNAVTNIGTVISQMFVATDPVTGTGGVIAAGTYVLTAASVYTGIGGMTGPTGTTYSDTLVIADGGAYERVLSIVDGVMTGTPIHQSGSFATDGASITVTQTCPPGPQPFTSFDSDGTTVRIYAPADAFGPGVPGVMFEYTRQ